MKTLVLVRHAKASRDDPSLPDRDRPLEERGKKDAAKMGKRLAKHEMKPDLIVTSPALRALTTAEIIAAEIGYERGQIVADDSLYDSSATGLLDVIRALDKKLDCVMLFGHNPEFADLARQLSSEITELATCAVAEFRFETKTWADVGLVLPVKSSLDGPKK